MHLYSWHFRPHYIVLADCDIKATINMNPPRKVYKWSKSDWQQIKQQTEFLQNNFKL